MCYLHNSSGYGSHREGGTQGLYLIFHMWLAFLCDSLQNANIYSNTHVLWVIEISWFLIAAFSCTIPFIQPKKQVFNDAIDQVPFKALGTGPRIKRTKALPSWPHSCEQEGAVKTYTKMSAIAQYKEEKWNKREDNMMRAIFDRLVREDLCKNLPFRKRTKQITGGERGFCGEHWQQQQSVYSENFR